MYKLLAKQFIRDKGIQIGFILLFLIGLLSLLVGKQFVLKQTQSISEAILLQQEQLSRNVQYHPHEMGLLLYYLRFGLVNESNPLTGLSIGQRDVNPSIQNLTIRGLENQKYDTDLNNPLNLLFGNLDFSFVLLYLFPLLIIAITYNILSEEKEIGTWRLVAAQTEKRFNHLIRKLVIRVGFLFVLFLGLIWFGFMYLKIPLNIAGIAYILISILYLIFWFSISLWVISRDKSSGSNLILLLSSWLFFTLLMPALLNTYLMNQYPVPESLSTVLKQREGYHEKWDMPKNITMEKFYAHYPHLRQYPLPNKSFSWLWYYGMQQMGDDDSRSDALELKIKLRQRATVSHDLALWFPTLHTQLVFNDLADSGLKNQLDYLNAVEAFHEKKRLYFYPKIFGDQAVQNEHWANFKVEFFKEKKQLSPFKMVLPLILISFIFILLGILNLLKLNGEASNYTD